MQHVTLFCFAASYAVALGLEVWHLYRRRPVLRLTANLFGSAGLLAQTIYLAVESPLLGWQYGVMLFLSWILAIFYIFGSLHHQKQAWGLFVLPLVLGLVVLARVFDLATDAPRNKQFFFQDRELLGVGHAALLVLAAVGTCVACVASIMYLVQARRLKTKALPGQGLRLPSLERLETMNRRALVLTFPLLTVGLLLGVAYMVLSADRIQSWTDPRVLATILLWLVFGLLLYLRFALHLRGRQLAFLTVAAFCLLLLTLAMPHMSMGRGGGQ